YTYILVAKDTYQNLGVLAGCKPEHVSKEIVEPRPVRPRPPKQPAPGTSRVGPPPVPPGMARARVSKPDDLAGNWSVVIRTCFATCKVPAKNRTETWSIAVDNGADITVNQGTGADDFIGSQGNLDHGMYQPKLATKNRPSANVLQITQSLR